MLAVGHIRDVQGFLVADSALLPVFRKANGEVRNLTLREKKPAKQAENRVLRGARAVSEA